MCDNCGMCFESFDEACQYESSCVHRKIESSLNKNTLASLNDRCVLNGFDFLLCRQAEVFAVSQEDMKDNTFTNGTVIGQVGLQCIHCSRSPLATAGHATVFLGSVASTGASLRMMAKHHFKPRTTLTQVQYQEKLPTMATGVGSESNPNIDGSVANNSRVISALNTLVGHSRGINDLA